MLRCLIVEDDESSRFLIRLLLQETRRYEVVGEAPDGLTAVALAARLQPDVVFLDLVLPGMDGVRVLPRLKAAAPRARVYVLSLVQEQARLHDAKMAGADGFLDKQEPNERLCERFAAIAERALAPPVPRRRGA